MGGVVTEEQTISHAQYLDLVYSQASTLYDLILDAPRPSMNVEVNVKVEVFDAPLDYNLLLGHSWIDSMCIVVSTPFHMLRFPH
jgi:hypothetical protein